MNNNRGNNRRRGRGNRNQGGGNQSNRIDSRARGNAPQLLDKYKKLAHDAQLNGDRVQAEYYLQFADHYFRVIADNKARKDEAQAKRQDDRGYNRDDDDDDDSDDRQEQRRGRGRKRDDGDDGDDKRKRQKRGSEGEEAGADDNPFTREARKPRKPRKKSGDTGDEDANGLDPSALPPSIASDGDEPGEAKPKRRTRKPKANDDGGTLEAAE